MLVMDTCINELHSDLLIFYLIIISFAKRQGVLQPLTIINYELVYFSFQLYQFYFMYLRLSFGAYTFKITMPS